MNVRVCGPNLRDQSKGQFHVHEASCNDLNYYGPMRKYGGDEMGTREMLVKDATVSKVIIETYADQIGEAMADEQLTSLSQAVDYFRNDFWFAPCCAAHLPFGNNLADDEPEHDDVFECWIDTDRDSFAKLKSDEKFGVADWVMRNLPAMVSGNHMHIVKHNSNEYSR